MSLLLSRQGTCLMRRKSVRLLTTLCTMIPLKDCVLVDRASLFGVQPLDVQLSAVRLITKSF
jgi:hypothetical protein